MSKTQEICLYFLLKKKEEINSHLCGRESQDSRAQSNREEQRNPKKSHTREPREDEEEEKMHSFGYRANALLTFALTILAMMCAMASFSDNFNHPTPSSQVQVSTVPIFLFPFHFAQKLGFWFDSWFAFLFFGFFLGLEHQLVPEATERERRGNFASSFFLTSDWNSCALLEASSDLDLV